MSNRSLVTAAALAEQVADVTPLVLARERLLSVAPGLEPLVGARGIQRGSTVAVHGCAGALTLSLALVAHAVQEGAWVAVVGGSWIGLAAVEEAGIALNRVVFVDQVDRSNWTDVTAAVLDGFDVVILAHPPAPGSSVSRQLLARARERNAILMRVGGSRWPDAADLRFDLVDTQWSGLGQGHGHLAARVATVVAAGRRGASQERRHRLWLPDADGICRLVTRADRRSDPAAVPGAAYSYAGSDIDKLAEADAEEEQAPQPDPHKPRHLRRVI